MDRKNVLPCFSRDVFHFHLIQPLKAVVRSGTQLRQAGICIAQIYFVVFGAYPRAKRVRDSWMAEAF